MPFEEGNFDQLTIKMPQILEYLTQENYQKMKDGRRSEESMRIGLGDIELEMMMII